MSWQVETTTEIDKNILKRGLANVHYFTKNEPSQLLLHPYHRMALN